MCTLTWLPKAGGGYSLLFNRDEKESRPLERSPTLRPEGRFKVLAPHDPLGDGTWIAVNEHGVTAALLNIYPSDTAAPAASQAYSSRGVLPLLVGHHATTEELAEEVMARVWRERFPPFQLWINGLGATATVVRWDGVHLHRQAAAPCLTSSSFSPGTVEPGRLARFASLPDRRWSTLQAFHRLHDPSSGAESILMRRSDARTRSITEVDVDQDGKRMTYHRVCAEGPRLEPEICCAL